MSILTALAANRPRASLPSHVSPTLLSNQMLWQDAVGVVAEMRDIHMPSIQCLTGFVPVRHMVDVCGRLLLALLDSRRQDVGEWVAVGIHPLGTQQALHMTAVESSPDPSPLAQVGLGLVVEIQCSLRAHHRCNVLSWFGTVLEFLLHLGSLLLRHGHISIKWQGIGLHL